MKTKQSACAAGQTVKNLALILCCAVALGAPSVAEAKTASLGTYGKPQGYGTWQCSGASLLETLVPGTGYLINGHFDKALVFGSLRWAASLNAARAEEDENYQKDFDDTFEEIDKEDSESGKPETNFYLNKSTYDSSLYGGLNQNLAFLSIYDFYAYSCEENTETYHRLGDPLNVAHYWDKWYFWAPLALVLALPDDDTEVNYFLGDGLKESYIRNTAFPEYYMVGIGEETVFRGVMQSFFNDLYLGFDFSREASWHLGVLSAAAVFGLLHQGQGIQATPLGAFLLGTYFGYVYQPNQNTYDIITASALHSWWDIIVVYRHFNSASFHESDAPISDKTYTLLNVDFQF